MLNQNIAADLFQEISTEEQELLSGGNYQDPSRRYRGRGRGQNQKQTQFINVIVPQPQNPYDDGGISGDNGGGNGGNGGGDDEGERGDMMKGGCMGLGYGR
jgi:hypothetical protein